MKQESPHRLALLVDGFRIGELVTPDRLTENEAIWICREAAEQNNIREIRYERSEGSEGR